MARQAVDAFEDECPRQVCWPSYYFRIHQIAQPDGTGTNRCDDGNIVQDVHKLEADMLGIQPKCYHETKRTTMTGQPFVAGKRPSLPWDIAYGQQHLDGMREVIARLVEQAMPQSCPDKDAKEAIHEHRVELLLAYLLLTIEFVHQQINAYETNCPKERVPSYRDEAQVEGNNVRVPGYE